MSTNTTSRSSSTGLVATVGITFVVLSASAFSGGPVTQTATKPTTEITLVTRPSPPVTGKTEFTVTVLGPDKKPMVGVDVSMTLVMPGMPSMNMPEVKSTVTFKPVSDKAADAGNYTGTGQIAMAGTWNATVIVMKGGKEIAQKKVTLTAK